VRNTTFLEACLSRQHISHPAEMDVLVTDIVYFLYPTSKLSWKAETSPYLPDFEPKEKQLFERSLSPISHLTQVEVKQGA